jgi:hypothetical protein
MIRTVLGEPTGTSTKFASMMEQALHAFEAAHGVQLDKITQIPLEGDGTIARRVEKYVRSAFFRTQMTSLNSYFLPYRLYANLQANAAWMADLHAADAVLVATHSQGSVVSTHLLARLIRDGHIVTARSRAASAASDAAASAAAMDAGGGMAALALGMGGEAGAAVDTARKEGDGAGVGGLVHRKVQRVCVLALCGIHLGPLRYLSSSTLVGPYLQVCILSSFYFIDSLTTPCSVQYFESTAARELFEFQVRRLVCCPLLGCLCPFGLADSFSYLSTYVHSFCSLPAFRASITPGLRYRILLAAEHRECGVEGLRRRTEHRVGPWGAFRLLLSTALLRFQRRYLG